MAVLIKNLLPAIRARLLMVSWVDGGLDLEGGGCGGGSGGGDNAIEMAGKWLMTEIRESGGANDGEESGFGRRSDVSTLREM